MQSAKFRISTGIVMGGGTVLSCCCRYVSNGDYSQKVILSAMHLGSVELIKLRGQITEPWLKLHKI